MKQQQHHDKKGAIENCVRSFIIKSIHAIVQARNGIVYNANCISAVGARNNLMVNIEEDPEIGATIKQTLDTGFPVRVRDCLSLEILTAWAKNNHTPATRMVVEVWQFRLDTADKLDRPVDDSSPTAGPGHPAEKPQGPEEEQLAVEDLRQSRLVEKLGTLLKAVMVATRLLPAYRLSRSQDPSIYQMCYILRRGPANLERLGPDAPCIQVGRLISGLVVQTASSSPTADGLTNRSSPMTLPDQPVLATGQERVLLNCSVHYRAALSLSSLTEMTPVVQAWTRAAARGTPPPPPAHRGRSRVSCEMLEGRPTIPPGMVDYNRQLPRVRPAFVEQPTEMDHNLDCPNLGGPMDHHMPFDPSVPYTDDISRHNFLPGFLGTATDGMDDPLSDNEDDLLHHHLYHSDDDDHHHDDDDLDDELSESTDLSQTIHPTCHGIQCSLVHDNDDGALHGDHAVDGSTSLHRAEPPLQLPFSNVGVSGDRLTQMFIDLRERANLDLFQVPGSVSSVAGGGGVGGGGGGGGAVGQGTVSQVQSAVFDADALSDELERHEKMLKEFDDFIADFGQMDLYAPQPELMRPLAASPNVLAPIRSIGGHLGDVGREASF